MSDETKQAQKTMYKEIEQDENVARGCVKVIEIIAYDPVGKKKNEDGKEIIVEKSRGPFFCQDSEDAVVFAENNPNARTESFTIQLMKSTAIRYLNDPENMRQFVRKGVKNG
jgi:hypothetical protein